MERAMLMAEEGERILTVTLSRPPANAINREWVERFTAIVGALERRDDISVLRIRSDQRMFCGGADLNVIRDCFATGDGPDGMVETVRRLQLLYAAVEALPQVTIAEIGGAAMGGGLELALACNLRVAATTAKLGLPELRLGLLPGAGGTQRLTRLAGRAIAARLILGAELVDGNEALALGLVQWAIAPERVEAWTAELAGRLAELPAASLAAAKRCIARGALPGNDGFDMELRETRQLLDAPETRRRVAAFLAR
jgi:enoyl-CoA hydratase/carnithine racemase